MTMTDWVILTVIAVFVVVIGTMLWLQGRRRR
jgi:uncharacterized membrane protein YqiK